MTGQNKWPGSAGLRAAEVCAKWGVTALTMGQQEDLRDFCIAAIAALETRAAQPAPQQDTQAAEQGEWRPIESAPASGEVLVTGTGGAVQIADASDIRRWMTHWMPRPSPPQAEEES